MSNISLKNNNIELGDILEVVNSLSYGKEEQEKSIEITENGATEVVPDIGKTLSKVTVAVNIESSESGNDVAEERSKWLNRSWTEFSDDKLSAVKDYTFAACTSLTTVNLPVCSKIGNYAFASCSSLTSVNLPDCNEIGYAAFGYCSSLTSIDLPQCTRLGTYAFSSCKSLTTINLPICSYITTYTFQKCSSLISIDLPMCSTTGNYTFQSCSALRTANLPAATSVGNNVFVDCTSLTSVNLVACSSIGTSAFQKCISLTSLTLGYSSVTKLNNINAFNSTPMSVSTLTGSFGSIYVPASLVDAYKSATNWITYADRITAIIE